LFAKIAVTKLVLGRAFQCGQFPPRLAKNVCGEISFFAIPIGWTADRWASHGMDNDGAIIKANGIKEPVGSPGTTSAFGVDLLLAGKDKARDGNGMASKMTDLTFLSFCVQIPNQEKSHKKPIRKLNQSL
jgi:hypothetical protein